MPWRLNRVELRVAGCRVRRILLDAATGIIILWSSIVALSAGRHWKTGNWKSEKAITNTPTETSTPFALLVLSALLEHSKKMLWNEEGKRDEEESSIAL
jgi:hypothetical protein